MKVLKNTSVLGKTLAGLTVLMCAAPAQALVMDFGSGPGNTVPFSTPFVQDGMSMAPVDTGNTSNSFNHWDLLKGNHPSASSDDWAGSIHTGNEAEMVEFTFGGAAFDLIAFDIEDIRLDDEFPGYNLVGTFTSSKGASLDVSSIGTVNFSTLAGFQNITSFTFSMPLGVGGSCEIAGQNCSTMVFDNIQFREASVVPVPAAAWLFGSGLLGLIGIARRKAA